MPGSAVCFDQPDHLRPQLRLAATRRFDRSLTLVFGKFLELVEYLAGPPVNLWSHKPTGSAA
jgi:hypothetical protein